MRMARTTILLAGAFALGTWLAGWWMVPVLAAVWALARPVPLAGLVAAAAGALAWGLLLAGYLLLGFPIGTLSARLAGAMRLPEAALLTLTLVLPALLAGSAAALATAARSRPARR